MSNIFSESFLLQKEKNQKTSKKKIDKIKKPKKILGRTGETSLKLEGCVRVINTCQRICCITYDLY